MTVALLLSLSLLASGAPADLPTDAAALEVPEGTPEVVVEAGLTPAPIFLGLGDITQQATCTAQCDPYADQTCSGGTCSAVDRNCSIGQRGYAQCDGQTHFCPSCGGPMCNECTDGDFRIIKVGGCCSQGGQDREIQQCQNSCWVTTGTMECAPSPQCPWIP